jgi:hypothetical protein
MGGIFRPGTRNIQPVKLIKRQQRPGAPAGGAALSSLVGSAKESLWPEIGVGFESLSEAGSCGPSGAWGCRRTAGRIGSGATDVRRGPGSEVPPSPAKPQRRAGSSASRWRSRASGTSRMAAGPSTAPHHIRSDSTLITGSVTATRTASWPRRQPTRPGRSARSRAGPASWRCRAFRYSSIGVTSAARMWASVPRLPGHCLRNFPGFRRWPETQRRESVRTDVKMVRSGQGRHSPRRSCSLGVG